MDLIRSYIPYNMIDTEPFLINIVLCDDICLRDTLFLFYMLFMCTNLDLNESCYVVNIKTKLYLLYLTVQQQVC